MSGYTPRVGDKVRATLGESVVVGEVTTVEFGPNLPVRLTVFPSTQSFERLCLTVGTPGAWTVEQVVTVPSKNLAIVGPAPGSGWNPYIFMGGEWREAHSSGQLDLVVERDVLHMMSHEGFTVLFDGVDE